MENKIETNSKNFKPRIKFKPQHLHMNNVILDNISDFNRMLNRLFGHDFYSASPCNVKHKYLFTRHGNQNGQSLKRCPVNHTEHYNTLLL